MDAFRTTGGLRGAQSSPLADKMIRETFFSCKHYDDMRCFFIGIMDGPKGSKSNSDDSYEAPIPKSLWLLTCFQLQDDPRV